MRRILAWKFALIAIIAVLAAVRLYPVQKTLKPGLDLAGGTSLIYEIDAEGLTEAEKKGLSDRMITVLRRRIDPAGIQNMIWRPHGNTRFEIQMPLASSEARQKRQQYEQTLNKLLVENINTARIMHSLKKPPDERAADFNDFALGSEERMEVLKNLAEAYDQMNQLREQQQQLAKALEAPEKQIEDAGLDLDNVQSSVGYWMTLDPNDRASFIKAFLGEEFSQAKVDLLLGYTDIYSQWSDVTEQLTNPETGKNIEYREAQRELAKLNLTEDQIKLILDMPKDSLRRAEAIEKLKANFPDRAELIDQLVIAFDEYRPFQGRLDDPRDVQRMLKGAGILEFRILPTIGQADSDTEQLQTYVDNLKEKGPRYASDAKYVWCELEDPTGWLRKDESGEVSVIVRDGDGRPAVVSPFGDKFYVLASNKPDEVMLHQKDKRAWKLVRAEPGTEGRTGRRAINFRLDEKGGAIFWKITGANLQRPLCILLDGLAISAPKINSQIGRDGQITGEFTTEEITDMVNKLNAGSLPARLIEEPISVKTIGPSIGADNRDAGIRAGIIGLVVVVICMAGYYLIAGSVADVALLLNILIILAAMAWLRATFTLPGIAGLILTIGMSVDANVLIFERIREEQLKGSSLRIAIKNGYQKAFRTIFDANLTTFITAFVLRWKAPEEVKGFAVVLMLGIAASMFTALFVTRTVFDLLIEWRVLKERLLMLQLIKRPNVNWMALRPVLLTVSIILIAAGLTVFFTRDDTKNNKYDIEFTGGTAVQINLKEPVHIQEVRDRINAEGEALNNPAIAAANVYTLGQSERQPVGTSFEINTTETNKTVTKITFVQNPAPAPEVIKQTIKKAQTKTGRRLTNLIVATDANDPQSSLVFTSQLNKSVVTKVLGQAFPKAEISEPELDPIVNNAVMSAFADLLKIRRSLEPNIVSAERITEQLAEASPELLDFLGGIKITCRVGQAATGSEIQHRFNDLRFKPDLRHLDWYPYKLLSEDLKPLEPDKQFEAFVWVSSMPEAGTRELSEDEWNRFRESETTKVLEAASLEESLPRVTQVNPSVGAEAKNQALIAIVLSLFAIVGYIWVRFGNVRYGLAAIAALVHDVCITLGAVTACTYIASTAIGQSLLIGDFKISQVIIAAFLTLIGYSLNDTIVVFDRIRENRKKAQLQPLTVTSSINQTISRTILTSFTTFVVVLVMYIFGGQNLRGFTFAIGFGIIIGTYSSIAIAAPLLLLGTKTSRQQNKT